MGMMNNCHFIVEVTAKQSDNEEVLEFLHPTVPGPTKGGWMIPPRKEEYVSASSVKKSEAAVRSSKVKDYTLKEVEMHNSEDSAWIIISEKVYDCTSYLYDHPGGVASIVMNAGGDATEEFMAFHSEKAKTMLKDYYIGDLVEDAQEAPRNQRCRLGWCFPSVFKVLEKRSIDGSQVALNPKKWVGFELIEKTVISYDTRLFKFKLSSSKQKLGLPAGCHMYMQARVNDELVIRAYTPVSSDDDLGYFTLCIKVYFAGVHPKFPDGGKMTQYMESMKIGESVQFKGPLGHFEYEGKGKFVLQGKMRYASKLGFICGGSGLTPAYQVIKAIYKDSKDITEVYLLYANQTEKDILMREDLEKMASESKNIHLWYTLDRPNEGWSYSKGFINEKMIRDHLPPPGIGSFVAMCGPEPMINFSCIPNLKKIGFNDDDYMIF